MNKFEHVWGEGFPVHWGPNGTNLNISGVGVPVQRGCGWGPEQEGGAGLACTVGDPSCVVGLVTGCFWCCFWSIHPVYRTTNRYEWKHYLQRLRNRYLFSDTMARHPVSSCCKWPACCRTECSQADRCRWQRTNTLLFRLMRKHSNSHWQRLLVYHSHRHLENTPNSEWS